ncbi:hypothetical protein SYNTR_0014 [Candidatus Syntrophocurvum alkaliphilum]|uniref:Maltose O-acetyltransferase n=1 Tax=Candidatus Syntrophocurvum alkaliphilum TaxID=2293317 RepID=A0A6I6D7G9_9FIRM|nr:DapH/DapD/GlmU-related protein [Candidatus Syntrophocurvum alkaliphilum]QGT98607.1 hypothetical protein SYNTR_0014 [Candidatus Syntrophocurvum alkaliphilum]
MLSRFKRLKKVISIDILAASYLMPRKIRCYIYKTFGMQIKSNKIASKCYFASKNITIGHNVFINHSCCFHNPTSPITIGDNTWVAMHVLFCTSTHEIGTSECRAGKILAKPIEIGKGCWIGANSTILPGVVIGDGCIIGAGAVVNMNCEPNGLYVGVPAKRMKDLDS